MYIMNGKLSSNIFTNLILYTLWTLRRRTHFDITVNNKIDSELNSVFKLYVLIDYNRNTSLCPQRHCIFETENMTTNLKHVKHTYIHVLYKYILVYQT